MYVYLEIAKQIYCNVCSERTTKNLEAGQWFRVSVSTDFRDAQIKGRRKTSALKNEKPKCMFF